MATLRTEAIVTAKDQASGTLKKIAGEFDRLGKQLSHTREIETASKKLDALGKVDTRALEAVGQAISESTRREIASMHLKEAELRRLSRSYAEMEAQREKTASSIGNARIRDQLRLADQALVEKKLLDRARAAHAERLLISDMSGRREQEAARAAAKAALATERKATADRLRAAREDARAARRVENEEARATSRERVRVARVEAHSVREATRREEETAHRARHFGRATGTMALGAVGVGYGAERGAHYAIEQGAEFVREGLREKFQGFSPEQITETQTNALSMSARFPSVSALHVREYARKATSVTGSYEHAQALLEDMVRTEIMLGVANKGGDGEHDVETLVQASEGLNRASSAAVLRPMLNAFVKAKTLYGDTVQAGQIRDYVKTAGTSVVGLDDSYLTTVMPAMVQELGGGRWGTAQMTALGAFSRPVQKKAQIAALARDHLLGPGNRFVGSDTARKNPYVYAETILTDALKRAGIDVDKARDFEDPGSQEQRLKIGDKLASWFPDRKASLFWEKHVLDKKKIDRNVAQAVGVVGNEGAETAGRENPYTGLGGVTAQIGNLIGVLSGPGIEKAGPALQGLALGIGQITSTIHGSPEAQKLMGLGTLALIPPAVLGAGKVATAVAGEGTGVIANSIRYGGRFATRVGGFGTRLLPAVGEAIIAKDVYDAVTPVMTEFGRIATGAYWQPKSTADVVDLREQRDALRGRVEGITARTHPSMRGEFNPEVDQLNRQVQELQNRIDSVDTTTAARNAALGIRGSSALTPVGMAGRSFGLTGPVSAPAGPGPAPMLMPSIAVPTPPPRPVDVNVTQKVEFSPIEVRSVVTVNGPGTVSFTGATAPVARSAGTSMAPQASSPPGGLYR